MKRILAARIVLTFIGVAVWGYGQRADQPGLRLAGIGILATSLVLRFLPRRWFEEDAQ